MLSTLGDPHGCSYGCPAPTVRALIPLLSVAKCFKAEALAYPKSIFKFRDFFLKTGTETFQIKY
uniref:Uncharacterized protein n=1 Tax=Anguilla anguilla TaxID=7936 RepID=A0A0E9WTR8_ANGAN